MKAFIMRVLFVCSIILRRKKEPFFKWKFLTRYLFTGYFFPSYRKQDFRNHIHVKELNGEKYVEYKDVRINYPAHWKNSLIKNNFNNILNEQTAIGTNINPHHYLLNRKPDANWIVYDLGAAEGSQSKFWVSEVKQIVLFEPAPSFYKQLQKTFKAELATGKVIIVNAGITGKKCTVKIENEPIEFDTLEALMQKYKLPTPNYIKADIEGEELAFLQTSTALLKTGAVKLIEVTTYHRPGDYIQISSFLEQFKGKGNFSEGVMVFNRDGLVVGNNWSHIYSPVIRKCLYSFEFN